MKCPISKNDENPDGSVKVNLAGRWAVWRAGGCDAGKPGGCDGLSQKEVWGTMARVAMYRCATANVLSDPINCQNLIDLGVLFLFVFLPSLRFVLLQGAVRLPVHLHRLRRPLQFRPLAQPNRGSGRHGHRLLTEPPRTLPADARGGNDDGRERLERGLRQAAWEAAGPGAERDGAGGEYDGVGAELCEWDEGVV